MTTDVPGRDPDLKIAGLSLWATGRNPRYPEHGWDAAWINTFTVVETSDARVEIRDGTTSMALDYFRTQLEAIDAAMTGSAGLDGNFLYIRIDGDGLGHFRVDVRVLWVRQEHRFEFDMELSEIRPMLRATRTLMAAYPVPDEYRRA